MKLRWCLGVALDWPFRLVDELQASLIRGIFDEVDKALIRLMAHFVTFVVIALFGYFWAPNLVVAEVIAVVAYLAVGWFCACTAERV